MGIAAGLPLTEDGDLENYAWPGGYEISYLTGGMDTLCWNCARKQVEDNIEGVLAWVADTPISDLIGRDGEVHSKDEIIVAYGSADQRDGCEQCVNCDRVIEGSGCDPTHNDFYEDCAIHGAEVTV